MVLSRKYRDHFRRSVHLITEAFNLQKAREISRLLEDQLAQSVREREEKIANQEESIKQLSLELNDIGDKIHEKKAIKERCEGELELKGRELRDLFLEISEGKAHTQKKLDVIRSALKTLSLPITPLNEELAGLEKDFSEKQQILESLQSQFKVLQTVEEDNAEVIELRRQQRSLLSTTDNESFHDIVSGLLPYVMTLSPPIMGLAKTMYDLCGENAKECLHQIFSDIGENNKVTVWTCHHNGDFTLSLAQPIHSVKAAVEGIEIHEKTIKGSLSKLLGVETNNCAYRAFLNSLEGIVHNDVSDIVSVLINAIDTNKSLLSWECSADGNYTIKLSNEVKGWVPSQNDKAEAIQGGVIILLGKNKNQPLSITGRLRSKCIDFFSGFSLYTYVPMLGFKEPNVFHLRWDSHEKIVIVAGFDLPVIGRKVKETPATYDDLKRSWGVESKSIGDEDYKALHKKKYDGAK